MANIQVKNIIVEAYDRAEQEYEFWEKELDDNGYDADNAIAAAQYYGQMCALATVQYVEHDDDSLLNRLTNRKFRLYKGEYE